MNKSDNNGQNEMIDIIPWQAMISVLLIALLLPFEIIIAPGEFLEIISQIWVYFPFWNYFEIFGVLSVISVVPFTGLRYIFAYQVGRYYKGVTTKRKTIAFGILGELPLLVLSAILFLQPFVSTIPLTIAIPLPLTLVVSLFLIRKFPQPKYPLTWKGTKKILEWWPEIDNPEHTCDK